MPEILGVVNGQKAAPLKGFKRNTNDKTDDPTLKYFLVKNRHNLDERLPEGVKNLFRPGEDGEDYYIAMMHTDNNDDIDDDDNIDNDIKQNEQNDVNELSNLYFDSTRLMNEMNSIVERVTNIEVDSLCDELSALKIAYKQKKAQIKAKHIRNAAERSLNNVNDRNNDRQPNRMSEVQGPIDDDVPIPPIMNANEYEGDDHSERELKWNDITINDLRDDVMMYVSNYSNIVHIVECAHVCRSTRNMTAFRVRDLPDNVRLPAEFGCCRRMFERYV